MWIKKEGCETVNTDHVQSIDTYVDEFNKKYLIKFTQIHNDVNYDFTTLEELNDFYEGVKTSIGAQEIPTLKI